MVSPPSRPRSSARCVVTSPPLPSPSHPSRFLVSMLIWVGAVVFRPRLVDRAVDRVLSAVLPHRTCRSLPHLHRTFLRRLSLLVRAVLSRLFSHQHQTNTTNGRYRNTLGPFRLVCQWSGHACLGTAPRRSLASCKLLTSLVLSFLMALAFSFVCFNYRRSLRRGFPLAMQMFRTSLVTSQSSVCSLATFECSTLGALPTT